MFKKDISDFIMSFANVVRKLKSDRIRRSVYVATKNILWSLCLEL